MDSFVAVYDSISRKIKDAQASKGLSTSLANKYLWDIITALRGPDAEDSSELKKAFTGRVRAIVGITADNKPRGLTVTPSPVGFSLDDEATDCIDAHFAEHIRRAVTAILAIYDVDILAEKCAEGNLGSIFSRDDKEYLFAHTATDSVTEAKLYNLIRLYTGHKYYRVSKPVEELNTLVEELFEVT